MFKGKHAQVSGPDGEGRSPAPVEALGVKAPACERVVVQARRVVGSSPRPAPYFLSPPAEAGLLSPGHVTG